MVHRFVLCISELLRYLALRSWVDGSACTQASSVYPEAPEKILPKILILKQPPDTDAASPAGWVSGPKLQLALSIIQARFARSCAGSSAALSRWSANTCFLKAISPLGTCAAWKTWLAELQQAMFVVVNPYDAGSLGAVNNRFVGVETPSGARMKILAMLTPRVPPGLVWMPYHFGGVRIGEDLRKNYPPGAAPIVLGEAVNAGWTYGYDAVTMMQETTVSLWRLVPA